MGRSRDPKERYCFLPRLEPLEDRMALASASVGVAAQVGSTLVVGVISPGISTTLIVENGQGDVAVALNSLNFNLFSGVSSIQVNAQGMEGNIIDLVVLAPLQTPELLSLNLTGMANVLFYHLPSGGASLTAQADVPVPFFSF